MSGYTVLEVRSSLEFESEHARGIFERWKVKPEHFGAFAVSETGATGWSLGHNTLRSAEATAIELCAEYDKGYRIIARMVSDHRPAADELVVSIRTATRSRKFTTMSQSRAFAIGDSGQSGWAWNYKIPSSAEERAMF